jgi:hypothetical protein
MQVSVVQFRPWAPTQKFGIDSVPFFLKSPTQENGIEPRLLPTASRLVTAPFMSAVEGKAHITAKSRNVA